MKALKKMTVILVLCMLFVTCFVACGEKGTGGEGTNPPHTPNETEPTPAETQPSILDTVTVKNYEGKDFVICSFANYMNLTAYTEGESDPIAKAGYERIQYINQTFNCKVKMEYASASNYAAEIQANENSKTGGAYDLVVLRPEQAISTMLSEDFINLLEQGNLSLDQEWHRTNQTAGYLVNNRLPVISTNLSLTEESTSAFVYNRALYQSLGGVQDLDKLVADGEWTLETFLTEIETLNATGGTGEAATFALASNLNGYKTAILWGYGLEPVKMGDGGNWYLEMNQKDSRTKQVSVLDALHELADSGKVFEDSYVYSGTGTKRALSATELPTSTMYSLFKSNRAVFLHWDIGTAYRAIADLDVSYGFLPAPKADTRSNYVTDGSAQGIVAIPGCLNAERASSSAAVLEALTRYTYVHNRVAFLNALAGGTQEAAPANHKALDIIYAARFANPVDLIGSRSVFEQIVTKDPLTEATESAVSEHYALIALNIHDAVSKIP